MDLEARCGSGETTEAPCETRRHRREARAGDGGGDRHRRHDRGAVRRTPARGCSRVRRSTRRRSPAIWRRTRTSPACARTWRLPATWTRSSPRASTTSAVSTCSSATRASRARRRRSRRWTWTAGGARWTSTSPAPSSACARRRPAPQGAPAGGSIVVMSSNAGTMGLPFRGPYVATKWGLIGLVKTLAMELGPHGIRVNAICPGDVDGERIRRVIALEAQNRGLTPRPRCYAERVEAVSLRTMVTADDVARHDPVRVLGGRGEDLGPGAPRGRQRRAGLSGPAAGRQDGEGRGAGRRPASCPQRRGSAPRRPELSAPRPASRRAAARRRGP